MLLQTGLRFRNWTVLQQITVVQLILNHHRNVRQLHKAINAANIHAGTRTAEEILQLSIIKLHKVKVSIREHQSYVTEHALVIIIKMHKLAQLDQQYMSLEDPAVKAAKISRHQAIIPTQSRTSAYEVKIITRRCLGTVVA